MKTIEEYIIYGSIVSGISFTLGVVFGRNTVSLLILAILASALVTTIIIESYYDSNK